MDDCRRGGDDRNDEDGAQRMREDGAYLVSYQSPPCRDSLDVICPRGSRELSGS